MTEAQEKVLLELTEDWSKKLEEAYLAYKKLLNYKVYLSFLKVLLVNLIYK